MARGTNPFTKASIALAGEYSLGESRFADAYPIPIIRGQLFASTAVAIMPTKTLDYQTELKLLEDVIRHQAQPHSVLQVLEAGCGREWYFRLDDIDYEITGVDLDARALAYRRDEKRDLDHSIIGDLRTVDLPSEHFDVVYCSFVLEHIQGAERVLDNFVRWLKPGGMLIVRVPDVAGVQTFLAKRLPRWCAILYYRAAWGIKNAGKPGFAPYRAYYDDVISPGGFHEYCSSRQLILVDELGVGTYATRGTGFFRYLLSAVAKMIALLSVGRIHSRHVDRTFMARKQDNIVIPASALSRQRRAGVAGGDCFGSQAKPGA